MKCPICGGKLCHEEVADRTLVLSMSETGNIELVEKRIDVKGIEVYCINNNNHIIPYVIANNFSDNIEQQGKNL